MSNLRFEEVKYLPQDHTAGKWQKEEAYPGLTDSKACALSITTGMFGIQIKFHFAYIEALLWTSLRSQIK
jgi:hypothetical protein